MKYYLISLLDGNEVIIETWRELETVRYQNNGELVFPNIRKADFKSGVLTLKDGTAIQELDE